jgi:hypothetical protein
VGEGTGAEKKKRVRVREIRTRQGGGGGEREGRRFVLDILVEGRRIVQVLEKGPDLVDLHTWICTDIGDERIVTQRRRITKEHQQQQRQRRPPAGSRLQM